MLASLFRATVQNTGPTVTKTAWLASEARRGRWHIVLKTDYSDGTYTTAQRVWNATTDEAEAFLNAHKRAA